MDNAKRNQQNLDQIRAILKRELCVNDNQVNLIFNSMKDINKVSPIQFDKVVGMLKTNYGVKNDQLVRLMCSNPPAELFRLENLIDKMRLFHKILGTNAPNYKYALLNNPQAFARTNDELESYIFEMKRDLGVNNEFVFNLLTRTNDFAHNIESYIPLAKAKMDYLISMGLTKKQITERPGILGNTINSISTRLIYALCNDLSIDEYLNESLFLSTEQKIHARTAAYRAGLIKKEHIYEPESVFVGLTGFKTEELKKVFPFNMHAKTALLREFEVKFPELSALSLTEYKKASQIIHEFKQQEDIQRLAKGEQLPKNPIEKKTEILNAIIHKLGEEKFTPKEESIVLKNFDSLVSMGFSEEEVIENPQALLLSSDRLSWRVKLAKINGLSNKDFLARGYRFAEMTIFPRTCGVKIMNTRSNATTNHIYNTELVFSKTFGTSTKNLAEHCKLNETGRLLLEKLYMNAVNAESSQEENE